MQLDIITMVAEIKETLKKYFKNLEDNDIQSSAIFLDPPLFKKYGFSNFDKFETCEINLRRKPQQINDQTSNEPVEKVPTISIP